MSGLKRRFASNLDRTSHERDWSVMSQLPNTDSEHESVTNKQVKRLLIIAFADNTAVTD